VQDLPPATVVIDPVTDALDLHHGIHAHSMGADAGDQGRTGATFSGPGGRRMPEGGVLRPPWTIDGVSRHWILVYPCFVTPCCPCSPP
jgi:hypothetical protein